MSKPPQSVLDNLKEQSQSNQSHTTNIGLSNQTTTGSENKTIKHISTTSNNQQVNNIQNKPTNPNQKILILPTLSNRKFCHCGGRGIRRKPS